MKPSEFKIIQNALLAMEKHFAVLCEHYRYWPDQGDVWTYSDGKYHLQGYLDSMSALRIMLTNIPLEGDTTVNELYER